MLKSFSTVGLVAIRENLLIHAVLAHAQEKQQTACLPIMSLYYRFLELLHGPWVNPDIAEGHSLSRARIESDVTFVPCSIVYRQSVIVHLIAEEGYNNFIAG